MPRGIREFDAPRFLDIQHMNVISLSALRTGRLHSEEIFLSYSNQALYIYIYIYIYIWKDTDIYVYSNLIVNPYRPSIILCFPVSFI